jgi:Tol biopolymer transport system component
VIFISDRTGTFSIYKQGTNQTVPELLVGGNKEDVQPRLSPDGSQLLYAVYPNSGEGSPLIPLMRMPLSGGAPQQILEATWISNHQCARAPATECIYSVVGEGELTFFTFDPFKGKGSQILQIKDDLPQLYNWSLSPDGAMLAIAKGKWGDDEPRIQLVSLSGGEQKWLAIKDCPGLASLDWAADSKSIWATSVGDEGNALLNIDLQGHARQVWSPKKMSVRWAIPSRDGRSLALRVGSTSANVWMAEQQ